MYKAWEHIHRSDADLRLLAIPASRRRIAVFDPNQGYLFFVLLDRIEYAPSRVSKQIVISIVAHESGPVHKGHDDLTSF